MKRLLIGLFGTIFLRMVVMTVRTSMTPSLWSAGPCLGNIAMSGYTLIRLARLRPADSMETLLRRCPA